jgi:hypothetical protein
MINFHAVYKNKDVLISCSTCKFRGVCKIQSICLRTTSGLKPHWKYTLFTKKIPYYRYENWEPKEKIKPIDMLLSDEDFEL